MHNDTETTPEPFAPEDMVNASELREFLFCERAWFLSGQGLPITAHSQSQRDAGVVFHEARASAANKSRSFRAYGVALLLALVAVALLIATALMDSR